MHAIDRAGVLERLKHATQALACSAETQLKLLPDFVCKADELALDFDHWRRVAVSNFQAEMTADQLSSLNTLDTRFSELTALGAEQWTEDAVRTSAEWKNIRDLAATALDSFHWIQEVPPSHSHEFIPAKSARGHDR